MLKALATQTEYRRNEDLAADSSVIKLKTLQATAEGVDDSKKELIKRIIS